MTPRIVFWIVLTACLGLPPATAQAQQGEAVTDLTLQDAIVRALERNREIAVERLNPQSFDFSIAALNAAYTPTFTSAVGQRSLAVLPTSQLVGGEQVTTGTLTYNSGLTQNLPWGGGNASLSFNNSRQETSDLFATRNPQYQSTLTANFVQPLLRGFRIDETRAQLRITNLNREIADAQLEATISNTLASVRKAYWDLVYALQAVEVAQQSLDLATRLVADNQIRVTLGTMAPIDIVQAQAEEANRRQTLAEVQATSETAEVALKRLLVESTNDDLWRSRLNPVDRPVFEAVAIDIPSAIERALVQRAEIAAAKGQVESSRVSMDLLRDQTLPSVNFNLSYGLQGLGGTTFVRSGLGGDTTQVIPGGYFDALSALNGFKYPTWSASLNISIPIGTSAAKANLAKADLQVRQGLAQVDTRELQIAADVTSAALQVQSTRRRVEASQVARDLADQQLDAEMSKFQAGTATNFQVVQAQRDRANAQNVELRALADYQKARIELDRVQQTSLSDAGIAVTGRT